MSRNLSHTINISALLSYSQSGILIELRTYTKFGIRTRQRRRKNEGLLRKGPKRRKLKIDCGRKWGKDIAEFYISPGLLYVTVEGFLKYKIQDVMLTLLGNCILTSFFPLYPKYKI